METYDVIVIGTGGVGSAALFHLAKRGCRVLGLDPFPHAHAFGSSHGHTRIIRQGYFEHPDYVPLLLRAYELWRELESDAGVSLFHQIGLLEVGPADGALIPGVLQSVKQHDLDVEQLSAREARARFPFCIPDNMQVILEPTGGYLLVEDCVRAHLQLAIGHGATWKQEAVLDWIATENDVRVRTDATSYRAAKLVICGGAWSDALLGDLGVKLQVLEKHQYWFDSPPEPAGKLPIFFFETGQGDFYGFPRLGATGLKLAQHSGGRNHDGPFDLSTAEDDRDLEQVTHFAETHARFDFGKLLTRKACMYTMTPDGHFLVDQHPRYDHVFLAAGMSGHGFKFAPVIGLALSHLACGESTGVPIEFLQLNRP